MEMAEFDPMETNEFDRVTRLAQLIDAESRETDDDQLSAYLETTAECLLSRFSPDADYVDYEFAAMVSAMGTDHA